MELEELELELDGLLDELFKARIESTFQSDGEFKYSWPSK